MKPFLWLFLVFMLLFSLLGGCKMQTIQPPADSSFADKEKELEIYCLESANLSGSLSAFREAYPDVRLSIEKFKTSRQMEDDLIGRIHTKDAPDVVLFDYSTTLDFEKLAGAMAFYPLTQLIAADETFFADNYLPAVMKDHSIDGEQYFLPFSVMSFAAFSPKSLLEELGLEQGVTSLTDYFAAAQSHALQHENDPFSLSFYRYQTNIDSISLMMAANGIEFSDRADTPDWKENIRQVVDCALFIDSQSQKANAARELDWTKIYWENTFCISSLYTDLGWDIMKGLSAYQSFFQDGVGYFALPSAQDEKSPAALLISWGSICADCQDPGLAYQFLRCMMDHYLVGPNRTNAELWFTPVAREPQLMRIKDLQSHPGKLQDGTPISALTEQAAQDVFRLWESIGDFQLPNPKYKEFFATSFAPYFQGTDSFDACYNSFCNRLFLYDNE